MRKFIPIFISILTLFIFPSQSFAYELKIQPEVMIGGEYISDKNLYIAGYKMMFDSTFENDLTSVAWNQLVKGTIFGDTLLFGNDIMIDGELFGDVRVLANSVHISGITNNDLVIVANTVLIDESAIINGDLLILGNTVTMNGQYLGENKITANNTYIHGEIVGPATITSQRLEFKNGAKVRSELSYFSPQRAIIESNVEIQKNLNFNQIESITQNDYVKRIFFAFVSFWAIIKLIATLFMIFILIQLFRVFSQRVSDIIQEKKATILLIGFLSILLIPALILILFGSLVLIPVSIILLLMYGIVLILIPAMSSIIAGQLYQKYVLKEKKSNIDFNMSALALILLTFIGFIPYVGSLTIFVLYIATFGAITVYVYEQIRRKKIKIQQ